MLEEVLNVTEHPDKMDVIVTCKKCGYPEQKRVKLNVFYENKCIKCGNVNGFMALKTLELRGKRSICGTITCNRCSKRGADLDPHKCVYDNCKLKTYNE